MLGGLAWGIVFSGRMLLLEAAQLAPFLFGAHAKINMRSRALLVNGASQHDAGVAAAQRAARKRARGA